MMEWLSPLRGLSIAIINASEFKNKNDVQIFHVQAHK